MVGFTKTQNKFHHEVTLKELLRYAAIAVLGLLGVAGMLQSLNGALGSSTTSQSSLDSSYNSVYGR